MTNLKAITLKSKLLIIISLILLISIGVNNIAFGADKNGLPSYYSFYVDGKKVERYCYKADDNEDVFVPIDDIVKKLGGKIENKMNQGQGINITHNGKTFNFDSANYYSDKNGNDFPYKTKTKSRMFGGVLYVPYQTLNELFGYKLTIKGNQIFLGTVPSELPKETPKTDSGKTDFIDLLPKNHPQYGEFEKYGNVGGDYNWVNGGYNVTASREFKSMPFDGKIDASVISKFDPKMIKAFESIEKLVKENNKKGKSPVPVSPKYGYPGKYNKYTWIDNNWIVPMLKSSATGDNKKDFKTLSDELQIPLMKDSRGVWYSALNQDTVERVMSATTDSNYKKMSLAIDNYLQYKYSPYKSKQNYIFPQVLKFYFPTKWEYIHNNLVGIRTDFKNGKEYNLTLDGKKIKLVVNGAVNEGKSIFIDFER